MSRKITFALLVLTMFFTAGSEPTSCSDLPGMQVVALVNNDLITYLSAGSSTIYTNQSVTFTATVTDENPNAPFTAERYDWSVEGAAVSSTTSNQVDITFVGAGSYYVEVAVEGSRGGPTVTDFAGLYVTVEDNPDGSSSDDSDDSTDPETPTVTISGPEEVMTSQTGSYSASISSGSANFTWDLLGDSATLGSTSGSSTTVTGVESGFVTLVVEARDSQLGNVLATASMSIAIVPEYVAWYTGNVDCWGAPRVYVTTRTSFNAWQSTASITGGGTDTTEKLIKVEMQGSFESQASAMTWICAQFTSRRSSYWCSTHYKMGGSYYTVGNIDCDFSDLPWDD